LKAIELHNKTDDESIASFNIYNSESKRLEKKTSRFVSFSDDFGDQLSNRLMMIDACSINENGGFVNEKVIKARFQADSLIAKRSFENKSNFILADDSDFAALLGDRCILIKNIKQLSGLEKRRGRHSKSNKQQSEIHDSTLFNVDMVGPCNNQMEKLKVRLDKSKVIGIHRDGIVWNKAETPIFRYKNCKLRATIALVLGCDVFKTGLKNIGRAKVFQMIENILGNGGDENEAELKLKSMFINSDDSLNEEIIDTLVLSFLYEPGIGDHTTKINASSYIYEDTPESFPKFLKIFAGESAVIVDGPTVFECNGSSLNNMNKHTYLGFEGAVLCSACNETFCKSCSFVPRLDRKKTKKDGIQIDCKIYYKDCDQNVCLDCFRLNRLGANLDNEENNLNKSLNDMERELNKNFGVQLDAGSSLAETVDIYHTYMSCPLNNRLRHLLAIEQKVIYPLLSADEMDSLDILGQVDMLHGGRFLNSNELVKDNDLVGVMLFLSTCLEHDDKKLVHTSNSDVGRYSHFPTMLLNFAFKSRIDSGYRLLDRCARHACDPRTKSLLRTSAKLFKYNG
jgi:hypothetical protein